jgi:arylformamidase
MSDFCDVLRVGASRRAVIGGAVAAGALLVAQPLPVWAQQMQTYLPPGVEPKPKGPLVFRDYDQEELNHAYDNLVWLTNREAIGQQWDQMNATARARLGPPRRLAYGPTAIEQLDLYSTDRVSAPINVFLHGGSWRFENAASVHFLAEMFIDSGAHFITVDFTNVIETEGELLPLVDQVRRAVAWVYENASSFGGDPNRIFVSGHSSGGHLAGTVLTTDWENEFGMPADTVKGGLCSSGMYDLYPVSLSLRSSYVNFTDNVISTLSPFRNLERLQAPIIVSHGSLETPEYQRQAREFARAAQEQGKQATYLVGEGLNHFEILSTLGNPYGALGRAVLQQMALAPG